MQSTRFRNANTVQRKLRVILLPNWGALRTSLVGLGHFLSFMFCWSYRMLLACDDGSRSSGQPLPVRELNLTATVLAFFGLQNRSHAHLAPEYGCGFHPHNQSPQETAFSDTLLFCGLDFMDFGRCRGSHDKFTLLRCESTRHFANLRETVDLGNQREQSTTAVLRNISSEETFLLGNINSRIR